MRQILYTLAGCFMVLGLSTQTQAQIQLPAPSPAGSVSSVVGLTEITVDYSRPKMRNRQIFGNGGDFLVPYGELWRTGANSGTVVSFSDSIQFGGKAVGPGKYLLFTVPSANSWEVMLYNDLSLGGNVAGYDKSKEVVRTSASSSNVGQTVQTFTINITDISDDNTSANLEVLWEKTSVKIPIKVDFDKKVMAAIERNTKVNPGNYLQAANYYFQSGRDLEQAIKWMDMYLATNNTQFWNWHTKAQMLKAKGDIAGAKAAAEESLKLAKAAPSDFGYIKRNEDFISSLPEVPQSGKKKKKK